ncbi:uncharacterized protein LY79DRAFT_567373 [Colletotrichum navitas]|uniref:Uncharacterized protein n=1 Tax=Colletotrichum navitas TaxID=681940 RepID=A0AAD8PQ82_9PEZI|nr:uncharacterized protein LY79DRAFT_567373 [Colletotrichum navitas]KAK1573921.1 hypothetical protein LY79DRAFT_567373 [Colletotrichum navitas]
MVIAERKDDEEPLEDGWRDVSESRPQDDSQSAEDMTRDTEGNPHGVVPGHGIEGRVRLGNHLHRSDVVFGDEMRCDVERIQRNLPRPVFVP